MKIGENKVVALDYKVYDADTKELLEDTAELGPYYYIQGMGLFLPKIEAALDSRSKGYKTTIQIPMEEGIEVIDFGTNSTESVDYPKYGHLVANSVVNKEVDFGILVCGTGIGISIAANKIKGIRAANCTNTTMAKLTRQHNDANILALGARIVGDVLALDIVDEFLTASFEGGRHQKRIDEIEACNLF